jgi:hypothetical protein
MQIAAADNVRPNLAQTVSAVSVRVLSGNLAAIPTGTLVRANVLQVTQGQAVIAVNGQTVTVSAAGSLQPGPILLVRNPGAQNTTLNVIPPSAQAAANPGAGVDGTSASPGQIAQTALTITASLATAQPAPSLPVQLTQVNVLAVFPDGQLRIEIAGQEETATSTEKLAAGQRYVLQVEETPTGLTLSSVPDSPELPSLVASAVLRASVPPDLAAVLTPLLAELAHLEGSTAPGDSFASAQQAAATVRDTVRAFLPDESRPLNARELQTLVEDGGLHYEAKLARLADSAADQGSRGDIPPSSNGDGASRAAPSNNPDLKESLLRLLQAAQELGGRLQAPAAQAALEGIEAQQAANVLAQTQQTPYIIQIPFPDGEKWRTLHLAIEADGGGQQSDSREDGAFRMLMHVPLTDLGETWIEAGVSGCLFRAVFYLSQSTMRQQVRAELPALREELIAEGFREVLLDVRAAADLPRRQHTLADAMRFGRSGGDSVLDMRA